MSAQEVIFPWNGKQTEAMIEILGERGIGFVLEARGLIVTLAEGTTEQECRALMAQALAERRSTRNDHA